ncbi:MAG: ATP-binding cassette domain-containing protein, partial [Bdellovibrionia bacterium]
MALVQVKNLSKNVLNGENKIGILRKVSFGIAEGDFVTFMGKSGSGKSTLISILGCLMTPSKGSYVLSGKELVGLSSNQLARIRNRYMGFVFQDYVLLNGLTVLDNVLLPLHYRSDIWAGEAQRRALECLAAVGMKDRWHSYPTELSGGQKQRVAIARALVNKPKVLFADEPCGALDATSRQEVLAIFQNLNSQGSTIVMVTHAKEDALHSKRIIYIENGYLAGEELVERPLIAMPRGKPQGPQPADSKESRPTLPSNLIELLGMSPSIDNMRQALKIFGGVTDPGEVAGCLQQLLPFVNVPHGPKSLLTIIRTHVASKDWAVKLKATQLAEGIMLSGDTSCRSDLVQVLTNLTTDAHSDVRHTAYSGLIASYTSIPGPEYFDLLRAGAVDKDARVRAKVALGMANCKLKNVEADLKQLLKDHEDRVRSNALATMALLWQRNSQPLKELGLKIVNLLED